MSSSEGTGAPISLQDSLDLLHKLSTESVKVQAIYRAAEGGIRASTSGFVRRAPDDTLWVMYDPECARSPFVGFDPALAVVRKYGDERALMDGGETPFGIRFRSALGFVFIDGSKLSIFECAEPDKS